MYTDIFKKYFLNTVQLNFVKYSHMHQVSLALYITVIPTLTARNTFGAVCKIECQ